jgi:hypothetical protein
MDLGETGCETMDWTEPALLWAFENMPGNLLTYDSLGLWQITVQNDRHVGNGVQI